MIWGGGVRSGEEHRSVQIDKVLCGGRDITLDDFRTIATRTGLKVFAANEFRGGLVVE